MTNAALQPDKYRHLPEQVDLARTRPAHDSRPDAQATADAVAQAEFVERASG